jgi:hypothetical protein
MTWKGEYDGKKYEDKGEILEVVPDRRLSLNPPGWRVWSVRRGRENDLLSRQIAAV